MVVLLVDGERIKSVSDVSLASNSHLIEDQQLEHMLNAYEKRATCARK